MFVWLCGRPFESFNQRQPRLRMKFRTEINTTSLVTPSAPKKPLAPSGKSVALVCAVLSHLRSVSRSSRTLEQDAMDADGAR
jgi:hypothetical protein